MSDKVPYIPFVDEAAAADDEEFDDAALIAEIDAERAARARLSVGAVGTVMRLPERPASLSVGAVGRVVRPERRSFFRSPVEVNMMQQMNPDPWIRPNSSWLTLPPLKLEPITSSAMRKKLLGRNNLARKLMVNLAIDVSRARQNTKKVQQISDRIERRVDGPKVREVVLPRITMNELHGYAIGMRRLPQGRPLLPGIMPPQFPTEVQDLPPFTQASCSTTKKQLQQQRDELIEILKEKHVMLLNLQTIYLSSTDKKKQNEASALDELSQQQGYMPSRMGIQLARAEHTSVDAITTLREQIEELRDRINRLREEITRRSKGKCSLLGGGKTKSKKSKIRNRKYSKRN